MVVVNKINLCKPLQKQNKKSALKLIGQIPSLYGKRRKEKVAKVNNNNKNKNKNKAKDKTLFKKGFAISLFF